MKNVSAIMGSEALLFAKMHVPRMGALDAPFRAQFPPYFRFKRRGTCKADVDSSTGKAMSVLVLFLERVLLEYTTIRTYAMLCTPAARQLHAQGRGS